MRDGTSAQPARPRTHSGDVAEGQAGGDDGMLAEALVHVADDRLQEQPVLAAAIECDLLWGAGFLGSDADLRDALSKFAHEVHHAVPELRRSEQHSQRQHDDDGHLLIQSAAGLGAAA